MALVSPPMQVINKRLQYNEIIVDGSMFNKHAIEAFFYASTHGQGHDQGTATEQHAMFHETYPRVGQAQVPLVAMDLGNWEAPFRRG